jgi:magnesium transporter
MTEPFSWGVASSVSISIVAAMSVAALVGTTVPLVFERLNVDPAVATGPFVTTFMDLSSIFCYFTISRILLGL